MYFRAILIGVAFSQVMNLGAQEASDIEALRKELRELKSKTEMLERKLERLSSPQVSTNPPSSTPIPPPAPEKAWSPTNPMRVGSPQNYINLSLDALVAAGTSTASDLDKLQLGGHDPKQRGFTLQNLEAVLDGKVDPYFRGQANLVFQIDPHGETNVEAEEAYLETMSLPANLQLKAGQFFTEFGRLNPTHPHSWDFADQPLVIGRFLGEDGLRSAGARLSWLVPTPFYSELFMTVANSQGGTAYSFRNDHAGEPFFGRPHSEGRVKSLGDMLFVPRYAASFDLTDSQTIVTGTSAAFGPNGSGPGGETQIYGADLFWKWKSPSQSAGFPFVTWQTEGLMRRYNAAAFDWDLNGNGLADAGEQINPATGLPALLSGERLVDYGMYSQVAYGFRKGWVAAFRGDYLWPDSRSGYESILGTDPDRASRWRLSPNITWFPSEFSKIRLQYNFDRRNGIGDDHSVWMQFEFLLGTHSAHQF